MKETLVFLTFLISVVYFGIAHRVSVVANKQANKIEMIKCNKENYQYEYICIRLMSSKSCTDAV